MEWLLCRMQYKGKSKTLCNFHFKNYRSDVIDRNAIPACRHFAQDKRRFEKYEKFALTESITKTSKPKEAMLELSKKQEKFQIRTLAILQLRGLNNELNCR